MRRNYVPLGIIAALAFVTVAFAVPTGQMVFEYNAFRHLNTNGSYLIKAGSGLLDGVCVNNAGATANTITLYDGIDTSGTVIAVLDGDLAACRDYHIAVQTGVYAVIATGTPGDFTITYR